MNIQIIHREQEFLVVNKPGGLLADPGRGPSKQDCVVNRIKAMYPDCIQQPAVHRLDMATSGTMLLASMISFFLPKTEEQLKFTSPPAF